MTTIGALDRKLLRDLWRRRGQVISIALVIASAVATLVVALSTLRCLSDARDTYYERFRFADVFVDLKRAPNAVARRLREIPGVAQVDTRVAMHVTIEIPGVDAPVRGLALSLDARALTSSPHAMINGIVLRSGRLPNLARGNEVLLHEAFAHAHGLRPGAHFFALMNGRGQELVVSGIAISPDYIYVIGPGDLVPDDARYGVFWMARDALAAAVGFQGALNQALILLQHEASIDAVIAAVDAVLADYGSAGAYGRDQQISNAFLDSEFGQLTTMAQVIPPIFLLVAAFLLYTIIARQIETQREEIGLLKAFGYSDAAVGWHFVKFALVVSAIALVLGWLAGAWLGSRITAMYGEFFRFPLLSYSIAPDTLLLSGLTAVGAASGGALVASLRAMRLAPAVAMAPPAPTRYGHTFIERLGVLSGLRATGFMVIRHVVRFPLRASLTVIGLALSPALLIAMLQFFDSITMMVDSFFFRTQRQDVTVHLVDQRADSVSEDLARLPGVMRVELRRGVSVQLRHGPQHRRAFVLGIDDDSQLSQQLNADGRTVALPPDGLVLSDRLARLLQVRAGDRVSLQVLEGKRAVAEVPVNQVVSDFIGLSAHMNRAALNRLTGDGHVADSAWMTIDHGQQAALFRQAKMTPAVLTITSQRQAYTKFRAMLDEHLVTMLSFYVGFAAIIAFGVAYNACRITLSERAHELATLRVLGYRRNEVAWILIAELALLLLASLTIGCALGYALSRLIIVLFTTDLYAIPFALERSTYGSSAVVVISSAMVSAAIVAWRVIRLDLVRALKAHD